MVEYLEAIRNNGDRLVEVADGHLDDPRHGARVEGHDVVAHTGVVHRRVTQIVAGRLTERPVSEESVAPPDDDLADWYRQGLDHLLRHSRRPIPPPMYTWHRPDRSAGFWIRRMAHNRHPPSRCRERIWSDHATLRRSGGKRCRRGLGPIMCAYTEDPYWEFVADGRTAELRMADTGDVRHLAFGTGKHGQGGSWRGSCRGPSSTISAPASDLDLWAWGRSDGWTLTVEGDPDVVTEIRSLAAEVT